MRILWFSNAPHTPTGYGTQTAVWVPRLIEAGHEIAVTAFYGVQGAPLNQNGVTVFPAGRDQYSRDVIGADAELWNADIVITLADNWIFSAEITRQFRHVPWMPVDHDPIPPGVVQATATAWQPMAYSKFGEKQLKKAGFKPLYVPHGIDTEKTFYPEEREKARKALGVPDDVFLVSMVAANKGVPSRKAFDQNIRAYAQFHARHPQSKLYIHTDWMGTNNGEDIARLVELAGLAQKDVIRPPLAQYARGMISQQYMRNVYSASDVVTNATRGEGFGLPIIEAQACGCPVIVGNWTAMPELVKEGLGWKVEASDKFYSQESYQFTPDVASIAQAMEAAYKHRGDLDGRKAVREWVVSRYDTEHVMKHFWTPALEQMAQRVAHENGRTQPVTIKAVRDVA